MAEQIDDVFYYELDNKLNSIKIISIKIEIYIN